MEDNLLDFTQQVNHARFLGQPNGHYESFFLRANHPTRPLAFWIRYTLFSPKNPQERVLGELWCVFFNGETNQHIAAKQEYPLSDCHFDTSSFDVRVGTATLGPGSLQGSIKNQEHSLAWELTYNGDSPPLLLLPLNLYAGHFPAAKSLVSRPMACFNGSLWVEEEKVDITQWVGSQNHNWGTRHTDLYAWGQVAGFDNYPNSSLEVATARLKLGPLWSPPITLIVLRHQQQEYILTDLIQAIRAQGTFRYFSWDFKSKTASVEIEGQITAPSRAFVGLNYYNPPGGSKHCLNSKIASCTLHLRDRRTGKVETLETKHRAAFEILTSDQTHGIEMMKLE